MKGRFEILLQVLPDVGTVKGLAKFEKLHAVQLALVAESQEGEC